VVAHHVDELMDIADRVYIFDDGARTLRQVPGDAALVKAELARLSTEATDRTQLAAANAEPAWTRALARGRPSRWFFRYLLEYGWALSANPLVFAFTATGGAIVGGVATWFGFNYRSIGRYLIPLLHDETLSGLGIMLVTVGVPLVVSVMLAARNAAVVAADLGNRSYALQFRAMRNLGIPGRIYIPIAITLAMMMAFLLLTLTSLIAAGWASFFTWKLTFPDEPFDVWRQTFFRHFGTPRHPYGLETAWTVGKVALSGLATAAAAMLATVRGGRSPLEINRSVGHAIVGSVVLALIIHAIALIAHTQPD
jgi:ABC-type transporter Mla maintaining outer membrane lipid asymmetry permease subunit MlaE